MANPKLDESKFKYLSRSKIHKQYLSMFLSEIWNVPVNDLDEYIKQFYHSPSALELVELNALRAIVKKNVPTHIYKYDENGNRVLDEKGKPIILSSTPPTLLDADDWKGQNKRYERMFGKEIQPIEIAGKDGEMLEVNVMSKSDLEEELAKKLLKALTIGKKITEGPEEGE